MLPAAVTTEAPTACGGAGTPASVAVRPRRETTGSGYASALPKPKKASAVKKFAAREATATSAATTIVAAVPTAETTLADSGATALLAAAAVLVSPPPSSQTQPLLQDAVNTGPTGTPSASPVAGTAGAIRTAQYRARLKQGRHTATMNALVSLQNEHAADPHTEDAETNNNASLLEPVSPASPTLLEEDAAVDNMWVSPEKNVRWTTVESIRLIVCSVDPRILPLLVKVGAVPERIDVQVSSSARPTFPVDQYWGVSFSFSYPYVFSHVFHFLTHMCFHMYMTHV